MRSRIAFIAFLTLAVPSTAFSETLIYDFRSPAAAALDSQNPGVLTVGGLPLRIEARDLLSTGYTHPGLLGRALGIGSEDGSGLGVDGFFGRCLEYDEELLFHFHRDFVPSRITFEGMTYGHGALEGVALHGDDLLLGPVLGSDDDSGLVEVLLPRVRALGVRTLSPADVLPGISLSSDPCFFVATIEGERVTRIPVDVMPGSCPNTFDPESSPVLVLALPGGPSGGAGTYDDTLRLAGVAPFEATWADVTAPYFHSGPLTGEKDCRKSAPDGHEDLVLKFDAREIARNLRNRGIVGKKSTVVLEVTARAYGVPNFLPFVGEDVVVLTSNEKGTKGKGPK